MEAKFIELNKETKISNNLKLKISLFDGKKDKKPMDSVLQGLPFNIEFKLMKFKEKPLNGSILLKQIKPDVRNINKKEFDFGDQLTFSQNFVFATAQEKNIVFQGEITELNKKTYRVQFNVHAMKSLNITKTYNIFRNIFTVDFSVENVFHYNLKNVSIETFFNTPSLLCDNPVYPDESSEFDSELCEIIQPNNVLHAQIRGEIVDFPADSNVGTYKIHFHIDEYGKNELMIIGVLDNFPKMVSRPFHFDLSMIPSTVHCLQPFSIKLLIESKINQEKNLTFTIDVNDDNALSPYGKYYYEIEKFPKLSQTSLSIEFIALKQGLLKFPNIMVKPQSSSSFIVDFQTGVFVTS